MAWDHDEQQCPLAVVDRRLEDLHRFWHQAEQAYFDPDAFRAAIQAAVQTARTVTLVLQKQKRSIPDFDAWYAEWQATLGADPLMRWMLDARNRIEKEGDLEARSFVSAEIVASYLDEGPKIQVPAKLSDAPLALVKSIPASMVGDHIRKDGILRIRRRWMENSLPEHELLDAVAHTYGQLSKVAYAAHVQMGLSGPATVNFESGQQYPEGGGRLPCMIGHEDLRTLDVWLATGEPLEIEEIHQRIDLAKGPDLKARYDVDPAKMYADSGLPGDHARSLFAAARKMFERDGYHITLALLFRAGKPVGFRELRPTEHGHKYMMMRSLAQEAQRLSADAAILISEGWSAALDPEKPYLRAVDSPSRKEFLSATVVSKDGDPLHLHAEILRDDKTAKLGETLEEVGGAHFAFAPLYEVWKKNIPPHWGKAGGAVDGAEQR